MGPTWTRSGFGSGSVVAVQEQHALDVLPAPPRSARASRLEQPLLPAAARAPCRGRRTSSCSPRPSRGFAPREHPLQDPVALRPRSSAAGARATRPWGRASKRSAACFHAGGWSRYISIVLSRLDARRRRPSRPRASPVSYCPHAVGDDHVAERDVAAAPGADAAHGEAAHPVLGDELRGGDDGLDAAHAEGLRDGDPQEPAARGHEGADADRRARWTPVAAPPRRCPSAAPVSTARTAAYSSGTAVTIRTSTSLRRAWAGGGEGVHRRRWVGEGGEGLGGGLLLGGEGPLAGGGALMRTWVWRMAMAAVWAPRAVAAPSRWEGGHCSIRLDSAGRR